MVFFGFNFAEGLDIAEHGTGAYADFSIK